MAEAPEDVYRAGIDRDPSILVMATAAVQLAVRESPTPEHVAAAVIEAIEPVIKAAAYAAGREAAARDIVDRANADPGDPTTAYYAALDIMEGRA